MSDKNLKALKEEIQVSRDNTEPHLWPVEYNGGHRKEIEVTVYHRIVNGGLCTMSCACLALHHNVIIPVIIIQ